MIDAGLAGQLMMDYWIGGGPNDSNIEILAPAIVGHEGGFAPSWPTGRCVLLTMDGKCGVHGPKKPMEGRLATHDDGPDPFNVHERVAMTWNSTKGRALVAQWRAAMADGVGAAS